MSGSGGQAPWPAIKGSAPPIPPDAAATAAPRTGTDRWGIDWQRAGQIATDLFGGRAATSKRTKRGEPAWEVEVADSRQGRI